MSIWISRARPFLSLLAAGLVLAACFENASLTRLTGGGGGASGPAAIAVLDGQVRVTGPQGYCIDSGATRESQNEAFVLLVRCTASPRATPVLSATVTGIPAPGLGTRENLTRLSEYLETPAGLGQLARSGRAEDVRVVAQRVEDGALWLRIEDRGNPDSFEPGYWRAILPVAERVVTLSVLSSRAHPVSDERGLSVLREFVTRMRAQNGG